MQRSKRKSSAHICTIYNLPVLNQITSEHPCFSVLERWTWASFPSMLLSITHPINPHRRSRCTDPICSRMLPLHLWLLRDGVASPRHRRPQQPPDHPLDRPQQLCPLLAPEPDGSAVLLIPDLPRRCSPVKLLHLLPGSPPHHLSQLLAWQETLDLANTVINIPWCVQKAGLPLLILWYNIRVFLQLERQLPELLMTWPQAPQTRASLTPKASQTHPHWHMPAIALPLATYPWTLQAYLRTSAQAQPCTERWWERIAFPFCHLHNNWRDQLLLWFYIKA